MVSCRFKPVYLNLDISLDFRQRHSLAIRIWHWSFFIVLTASLFIVGLASTFFRGKIVGHDVNDRFWALHTWLGYILCFFMGVRIIIEAMQPSGERLFRRLKAVLALKPVSVQQRGEVQHLLLVKRSYLVFYGAILLMAFTGLVLAFEDEPLLKSWQNLARSIHALVQYVIYGYVILHLAGVIRADLGHYPGIVSSIINGKGRKSDNS
jgi:cytochrome b561